MNFQDLATVNAILNATSAIFLIAGYLMIRQGRREAHRNMMVAAFSVSVVFLICYLIYHYQVGHVSYTKTGPIRTVYFAVLISHIVLAALTPFLAIITLVRALKGQFEKHRKIARWTLPIWLYVSVTGVAVYWMLYRM
jgi:uncharacterized membrane protein YozB (DUF420 family)